MLFLVIVLFEVIDSMHANDFNLVTGMTKHFLLREKYIFHLVLEECVNVQIRVCNGKNRRFP